MSPIEQVILDSIRDNHRSMRAIKVYAGWHGFKNFKIIEETVRQLWVVGALDRDMDSGPHDWYSKAKHQSAY